MRKVFFILTTALMFFTVSCIPKALCVEKIKPDCLCVMVYEPVCGCNNKTYGNVCEAGCAGITEYIPGKCK